MTRFRFDTCRQCGETNAPHYHGVNSRCAECHKLAVRELRRVDPKYREYDRDRAKTEKRKAHMARVASKWRADHPDAYKAQTAVGNAIRDGKLRREPCFLCEATEHVHAHHSDYSKPLDVRWVCAKCHHRLHAAFPEIRGHGKAASP